MTITVTAPASSTKLTTIAAVQLQLGIAIGIDDELIDQLIATASDFIAEYTSRKFARERWTEIVPAYNSNWLQLTLTPIESINSIAVNGTVITDYLIEEPDAGLLFREIGWTSSLSFSRSISPHPLSRSSLPRFTVDYYGGYVLPSFTVGDINLPATISQACIDLVRDWYERLKSDVGDNVKQIKIGDYSISYDTELLGSESLGVSPKILAKLRSWRRQV